MKGNSESGVLEIPHLIVGQSYKCNYECVGCNATGGNSESISSDKMLRLVDNWADYVRANNDGKGIFHLKGGEPFMFEGFDKLTGYVADRGLYLFITTNGSMIEKDTIGKLKDVYQKTDGQIIVSLDGSDEKVNSLIRPVGSYTVALNAIENLVDVGIPVAWNYRVHKGNQSDLEKAVLLAKDVGVTQFNVLYHTNIKNRYGRQELPEMDVVVEQLKSAMAKGASDITDWSVADMIEKFGSGEYSCGGCVAGFKGFAYVTPSGGVYSCPNTVTEQHKLGTIDDSFEEIFSSDAVKELRESNAGRLVCKGELESYEKGSKDAITLDKSEKVIIKGIGNISKKKEYPSASTEIGKRISLCFNRNY